RCAPPRPASVFRYIDFQFSKKPPYWFSKFLYKIALPSGTVDNVFQLPMQVPVVKVLGIFSGEGLENTIANQSQVGLLGDVLGNIYTNTLREEEGGTYSPSAFGQYLWNSRQWMLLYLFITNDEMSDRLQKRAYNEAMELLKNGTDADMFNKVRGAAINQHEIEMRNNGFWITNIQNKEMGLPVTVDEGDFLRGLTLEQFNAFVKGLKPADNYIKVVMDGVPVE
ncbi:MAG: insulinase family protein, partial [Muribaculaceae bacterium]|nr:insulinase family protein [Muribaculaceae bacterium]